MDNRNKDRLIELREKRLRIAEAKAEQEKVAEYGPKILFTLNSVFDRKFSMDDFDPDIDTSFEFKLEKKFDNCKGLVTAYVSQSKVIEILNCCYQITGKLSGRIAIDGCKKIGSAKLSDVNLVQLVTVAEELNDTVLFYPNYIKCGLLVDRYRIAGMGGEKDFSIVIQGQELEEKLSDCFIN